MRYVSNLYSNCTRLPVKKEVPDNIFTSLDNTLFKDKVAYDNENLVKLTLDDDDVEENVDGNDNEITNHVFFFLQ